MLSKRNPGAGTNRSFRISVNNIGIRITASSKRRLFGTSAVENLREAGRECRAPALIKLGYRLESSLLGCADRRARRSLVEGTCSVGSEDPGDLWVITLF